jgi:chemotaxis protein histidine kinase CheA
MQPEQQQRIMGYFIEEAKDHLNTIERGLLNLQSTIEDTEMVNEVFRAAHSVKGGAAMLGITAIQHTSHRLEDYFKILKETAGIRVDQQLESLLLRVFDTLQELLEQLQGPFGLTEEASTAAMAGIDPVFVEIERHLGALSGDAVMPDSVPTVVGIAHPLFNEHVSADLREMLELFKQAESLADGRDRLLAIADRLLGHGQLARLDNWVTLLSQVKAAIANPDNAYRTLAAVVIKELKQAQDWVKLDHPVSIGASAQLLALLPMAADLDLATLDIAAGDLSDDSTADFDALFNGEDLGGDLDALDLDQLDGDFSTDFGDDAAFGAELDDLLGATSDDNAAFGAELDSLLDDAGSDSVAAASRTDLDGLFDDFDADAVDPAGLGAMDDGDLNFGADLNAGDDLDLGDLGLDDDLGLGGDLSASDDLGLGDDDLGLGDLDFGAELNGLNDRGDHDEDDLGLDLLDQVEDDRAEGAAPAANLSMEMDEDSNASLENLGELFMGVDESELTMVQDRRSTPMIDGSDLDVGGDGPDLITQALDLNDLNLDDGEADSTFLNDLADDDWSDTDLGLGELRFEADPVPLPSTDDASVWDDAGLDDLDLDEADLAAIDDLGLASVDAAMPVTLDSDDFGLDELVIDDLGGDDFAGLADLDLGADAADLDFATSELDLAIDADLDDVDLDAADFDGAALDAVADDLGDGLTELQLVDDVAIDDWDTAASAAPDAAGVAAATIGATVGFGAMFAAMKSEQAPAAAPDEAMPWDTADLDGADLESMDLGALDAVELESMDLDLADGALNDAELDDLADLDFGDLGGFDPDGAAVDENDLSFDALDLMPAAIDEPAASPEFDFGDDDLGDLDFDQLTAAGGAVDRAFDSDDLAIDGLSDAELADLDDLSFDDDRPTNVGSDAADFGQDWESGNTTGMSSLADLMSDMDGDNDSGFDLDGLDSLGLAAGAAGVGALGVAAMVGFAPHDLSDTAPSRDTDEFDHLDSLVDLDSTTTNAAFNDDLDALLDDSSSLDEEFAGFGDDEFGDLDGASGVELDDDLSQSEFSQLDALLTDDESTPDAIDAGLAALAADPGFDDLDLLLLDDKDGLSLPLGQRGAPKAVAQRRSLRAGKGFSEQTMRVSVKHLDSLSNLVGELVVNRNSLEQDQERMRQSLDNLLYQVQQLSDVGQRMQDLYERSLLESSLMASRQNRSDLPFPIVRRSIEEELNREGGVEYDPLEMDRFTGFHTLSQEMIELIVRVRESASDIEFIVDETDQVTRMFRQVTTQLQEGLTRSRMVPFAQTADRLPRAVRDIAMKVGKQAELIVEGRDTLIDKMILEHLYDPMTHLVNNAITHGVEMPDVRKSGGKPDVGKITIRAFHQGNQTVISVSDDGAGIDIERVRMKGIEKGLISSAEAQTMSRLDLFDLIFHPGFSTRDQADDFAGRGVGMDVVRTSLTEIRGAVTIDSNPGKGTTFTIRLPLTLSISKALCCISDKARIAFPMDGVEDMLDLPKDRLRIDADGQMSVPWRDTCCHCGL